MNEQRPPHSPGLSIGHTEQAAMDQQDPEQRRKAEQDAQWARVDEAIAAAGDSLQERVTAALREVYDPEIPINIYELGLIYEVDVDEQNNVRIIMTLTSPACPVAQELPQEVRQSAARVPEANDVSVELTFDPPWSQDRMSDAAKLQLGML